MIYVYAIGESHGRLAAFVGQEVAHAPDPEPDALLDHDRVVYGLMQKGPVLPMRFGTVVADHGEIRSLLLRRRRELRRMLDHVRGRVEFGIRRDLSSRPSGGREYMQAKLDAGRTPAPLAELAVDTRTRQKDTAYLVDRDLAAAFQERARALRLSLSGPWPPYSFTGALDA